MSPSDQHEKNPERVAAGLKAAINNPNVSEQAKDNASERLTNMGADTGTTITEADKNHAREVLEAAGYHVEKPSSTTNEEHEVRVLAGYKAALNNPRVSDAAKRHAEEYLKARGAI